MATTTLDEKIHALVQHEVGSLTLKCSLGQKSRNAADDSILYRLHCRVDVGRAEPVNLTTGIKLGPYYELAILKDAELRHLIEGEVLRAQDTLEKVIEDTQTHGVWLRKKIREANERGRKIGEATSAWMAAPPRT